MDLLTDLPTEAVPITLHLILDQITEITTAIPSAMTHTTDKATTETTIETEATNRIRGMTKETRTTKTGMTITMIETGLTTEDNQINTNTTETSRKHRSSSNTQIRTW